MTDTKLKGLNRREMLEILLEQSREIERLQAKLEETEEKLRSRELEVRNFGTLAEAVLALNRVCENTDAAAEQYLENIRRCSDRQQAEYDRIVTAAEERAAEILAEAESAAKAKREAAVQPEDSAEESAEENAAGKVEDFAKTCQNLRDLLSAQPEKEQK